MQRERLKRRRVTPPPSRWVESFLYQKLLLLRRWSTMWNSRFWRQLKRGLLCVVKLSKQHPLAMRALHFFVLTLIQAAPAAVKKSTSLLSSSVLTNRDRCLMFYELLLLFLTSISEEQRVTSTYHKAIPWQPPHIVGKKWEKLSHNSCFCRTLRTSRICVFFEKKLSVCMERWLEKKTLSNLATLPKNKSNKSILAHLKSAHYMLVWSLDNTKIHPNFYSFSPKAIKRGGKCCENTSIHLVELPVVGSPCHAMPARPLLFPDQLTSHIKTHIYDHCSENGM